MLGLVLEGGGAKGSYHAGAIKALHESGYSFDGVMGTSIGAINGAIVAQGDTEKCIELWETLTPSRFIDVDDEKMTKILTKKYDGATIKYLLKLIKDTLLNRGFSVERVMKLLKSVIDEDKLRGRQTDFGLITVSITDRLPVEVFKEEIPYGLLHDYIMASAYYPAFRNDPIDGKKYMDGGIFDNLPINPLIRKGYDEIIAVRTMSSMPHRSVIDDTVKITYITPSDDIGGTVDIYADSIEKNINMGYFDTMKILNGYKGKKYYFYPMNDREFIDFLFHLSDNTFISLKKILSIDETSDKIEIINRLLLIVRAQMKDSFELSDYEVFLLFLEKYGKRCDIDKFKVYGLNEYIGRLKEHMQTTEKGRGIWTQLKSVFENRILNNLLEAILNG